MTIITSGANATVLWSSVSETPLFIYFLEIQKGVMAYSLELKTSTTLAPHEDPNGITFDFINNRLYWCGNSDIFAAHVNGSTVSGIQPLYKATDRKNYLPYGCNATIIASYITHVSSVPLLC